jgi:type IV secretory pathway TraG/TraD family ATPase VirD4
MDRGCARLSVTTRHARYRILFGYPLYAPWKFFLWWYAYDAYARDIFETGALIFLAGVIISVATAFGFSLWRSREAKDSDTYGSARWATRAMSASSASPPAMASSSARGTTTPPP